MNYEFLKILVPISLFALGHLLWVSRKLSINSVCVTELTKKIEAKNTDLSGKIDKTNSLIDKFEKKIFEDGKAKFVYNDRCQTTHEKLLNGINELKAEFVKRDDSRMEAHKNLHRRLDEQEREIIELQCFIKELKKS